MPNAVAVVDGYPLPGGLSDHQNSTEMFCHKHGMNLSIIERSRKRVKVFCLSESFTSFLLDGSLR